ncbi:MAG: Endo,4-beta-xylanase precursor [Labilithrix sp.]|nr:Endo,4-beta-xylanase precursor [Labilithrix sp.]
MRVRGVALLGSGLVLTNSSMRRPLLVYAVLVACSSENKGRHEGSRNSSEPPPGDVAGGGEERRPTPSPAPNNPDPNEPTTRPLKHYDVNHVLSTGQSDSVANGAAPFVTTTQPFGNLSFDVGVMTGRNGPGASCDADGCTQYDPPSDFVPLIEGDQFFGYGVETMSSGLANQATVFARAWLKDHGGGPEPAHDILVSLHGRSGNTYWCLRKGFCNYMPGYLSPFEEALMQVKSAKAIAAAKGKSYVVRGVTAIHGGSDHYDKENELSFIERTDGSGAMVSNYAEALLEWQHDYETEIRAITGQTEPIPLFVSQFGSWTDTVTSAIPVRQLEAHVRAPGKVVVVTPNYPFTHFTDCLHYSNYSQRRLGAYFAKAYQKTVVEGGAFEPLRPLAVTLAGNVLTAKFHVPVPPMVIDTTRVVDPGNYGFTYADSTSSATITNVALAGPDTVTITLSAAPTGAARKLRYALNAPVPHACPGPTGGARGNLRDSDATVGYHSDADGKPYELHNWAVHFELPVP